MRRSARTVAIAVAAAALLMPVAPAQSQPDPGAAVQGFLADRLESLTKSGQVTVLVHGTDLVAADRAVAAAGMSRGTRFEAIGVVVARGTRDQVEQVRQQPGVTYLEGNQSIELTQYTSNTATRGAEAAQTLTGANGSRLDGDGVSVAVIDSGVDPNHPYLENADGSKAVVSNQKVLCEPTESLCQVLDVGTSVDTDTLAVGGHGTHVAGIVAGRPTVLADGRTVQGAAPGANLVSLSTGAALFILGADTALNWVLENHEAPCGAEVAASVCPPIKAVNNSYGPTGGGAFDPDSATVKLQRALAAEGVVMVWANGNDGGNGSEVLSNPPGMDPTGGVISVASYNDLETGTREGEVSDFSSRGQAGDASTYPDISAPGDTITSSCRLYLAICSTGTDFQNGPGPLDIGTFNTISGTSMAAPHIAGIVAQLFQKAPEASPAQVESAIRTTAHKYTFGAPYEAVADGPTTSFDKGAGLVDVVAAANTLP